MPLYCLGVSLNHDSLLPRLFSASCHFIALVLFWILTLYIVLAFLCIVPLYCLGFVLNIDALYCLGISLNLAALLPGFCSEYWRSKLSWLFSASCRFIAWVLFWILTLYIVLAFLWILPLLCCQSCLCSEYCRSIIKSINHLKTSLSIMPF